MAINNKVMLNAIKAELDKRGHSTRLLPRETAKQLYSVFVNNGYSSIGDNIISNNLTKVAFTAVRNERTKVVFTKL